jgi:hypothetical protein
LDTDDFTQMTYECIILANRAASILKAQLGVQAEHYTTEDEYLLGIKRFVTTIEKNMEDYYYEWSLQEEISLKLFKERLLDLKKYINKTIKTSLKDREIVRQ